MSKDIRDVKIDTTLGEVQFHPWMYANGNIHVGVDINKPKFEFKNIHQLDRDDPRKVCETNNYFWCSDDVLLSYLSMDTGGAIQFRGLGRWSGNVASFSYELGVPMAECYYGNSAGYAIEVPFLIGEVLPQVKGLCLTCPNLMFKYHFELVWRADI